LRSLPEDVSTSLLRYWESEFPSLKPKKDRRGDRKFQVKDIKELQQIHHLVKERGFTLEGAKKELKEGKTNTLDTEQLRKKLQDLRDRIQKKISQL